jgi:hypothetical protein
MPYNTDWLPRPRTEILEMCRVWIEYLTAARRTAWGIPQDQYNEQVTLFDAAQELLYKVVAPGGEAVTSPKQLDESFYTRRMRDVFQFEYEDSGKTVYIAVQVENDGKKGDWGPLVSAVIP